MFFKRKFQRACKLAGSGYISYGGPPCIVDPLSVEVEVEALDGGPATKYRLVSFVTADQGYNDAVRTVMTPSALQCTFVPYRVELYIYTTAK